VKLLAGTSGFAFKEWKGSFYPKDCKPDAMLGLYSAAFPTVEINNTFYRLPKENVLLEWAEQVPEPFTFAIKASQRITHFARLKPESASAVATRSVSCSSVGASRTCRAAAARLSARRDWLPASGVGARRARPPAPSSRERRGRKGNES